MNLSQDPQFNSPGAQPLPRNRRSIAAVATIGIMATTGATTALLAASPAQANATTVNSGYTEAYNGRPVLAQSPFVVEQPTETKRTTATGKFHTKDAVLYGPDGKQFIPQGANLGVKGSTDWGGLQEDILADNSWGSGTAPGRSTTATEWGFNTVRVNLLVTDLRSYGQVARDGYAKMMDYTDGIVKEYTSKGIVVILEPHEPLRFSDKATQDRIQDQVEKWYKDTASRYKGNTYVWFGSPNEPDFTNQEWRQLMDRYIRAVRSQGAENIFSVGTPTWGQDLGTASGNFPGSRFSYAADMMPALNTTVYSLGEGKSMSGNLLTEQHNYGGKCENPLYPSPAAIKGYVDAVANASGVVGGGTPVLFGEFGYDQRDTRPADAPNPRDIWGGTSWGSWTCSFDTEKRASYATMGAAKANGAGLLFWHGTHGGDGRSLKSNNRPLWHGGSGVGLSTQGSRLWDVTHSPLAVVDYTVGSADLGSELTPVTVSGNVSDKRGAPENAESGGVRRVDYVVDGAVVASDGADGSESVPVNRSLPLAAGDRVVEVRVVDGAGNVTTATMGVVVPAPDAVRYKGKITGASATSFGASVPGLPSGWSMLVEWDRGGARQFTRVNGGSWWSGNGQAGWSGATVSTVDNAGRVVAVSDP